MNIVAYLFALAAGAMPVQLAAEIVPVNPVCDATHCKVTLDEWKGIHETQGILLGRINALQDTLRKARACPIGRET